MAGKPSAVAYRFPLSPPLASSFLYPSPTLLHAHPPLPYQNLTRRAEPDTARALKPRPRDPWLARDKAQHLAFSFLWTLASQYTFVNKIAWSERDALPASMASAALVGLAKEVYDRRGPTGYFSKRALVADALGILLGAGLILL